MYALRDTPEQRDSRRNDHCLTCLLERTYALVTNVSRRRVVM
jgi:hypothetical protein